MGARFLPVKSWRFTDRQKKEARKSPMVPLLENGIRNQDLGVRVLVITRWWCF